MTFSKVIIDGDQMIYSCGFASEGEPLSHTLRLLKNKMEQILSDCGTDHYELYIEGQGNFREEIDWDYKGTRLTRKPASFQDCKEYLRNTWKAKEVEGMETDDAVSIRLWQSFNSADDMVLSSPDKDLKNTPGWHYNPNTRETYYVTPEQASRHFWFQMLMGDRVDNIKGLPYCAINTVEALELSKAARKGCGKATAAKIIKSTKTAEEASRAVVRCYADYFAEQQFLSEGMAEGDTGRLQEFISYFVQQGQLLHMTRELDEFNEPKRWENPFTDEEMEQFYTAACKGEAWEEKSEDSDSPEQEAGNEEAGVGG